MKKCSKTKTPTKPLSIAERRKIVSVRKFYPFSRTDGKGIKHIDKRVCYTVETTRGGDRIIKTRDATTELSANGEVLTRMGVEIHLERTLSGKWLVDVGVDTAVGELVELLRRNFDKGFDFSGNLADAIMFGVQSDELTDAQAEKVRKFFTPDWLDEAK